jgi:multimeric flavodoxin WrbA
LAGPQLLIVFHSLTGGTQAMAQAAALGAEAERSVVVRLKSASDAQPADLLTADGFLFAAPEMLGSLAGVMKDFFDRCYYPVLGRIEGRAYATMICAGSDGENAARQLARIVTGWRLRAIADPLILCTSAQTPEAILAPKRLSQAQLEPCQALGTALATGLAMGIY